MGIAWTNPRSKTQGCTAPATEASGPIANRLKPTATHNVFLLMVLVVWMLLHMLLTELGSVSAGVDVQPTATHNVFLLMVLPEAVDVPAWAHWYCVRVLYCLDVGSPGLILWCALNWMIVDVTKLCPDAAAVVDALLVSDLILRCGLPNLECPFFFELPSCTDLKHPIIHSLLQQLKRIDAVEDYSVTLSFTDAMLVAGQVVRQRNLQNDAMSSDVGSGGLKRGSSCLLFFCTVSLFSQLN
ncbi:hypothetical protein Nepgr_030069 [Nepenthes gracilis]|uniref:Uncharacterized protein n=1 Tax=Nepenthes gracilis TaxID=150966 RepID=A0AAD3TFI1_NEPGR|nr:hypothetical protein Nepgr_030069 [Nepenthes gracilis]